MMYKGKHEAQHSGKTARKGRLTAMIVSVVLILALAIGGTIAWMSTKTDSIKNTFNPSKVTCEVTEKFENNVKTNVNVKNTGDTDAYIRVRLVSYRTNDAGDHIGGTAALPEFTLGANWVQYGDYYYYTLPVAPNATPTANLTNSMMLTASYDDADGGHQSIDVMAEAIQAGPAEAVGQAWKVSITPNSVTAYSGN